MIEEEGRVVAVDDQFAWVLTIQKSSCQSCSARAGCGQKLFNQVGSRSSQIKVVKTVEVQVGDRVLVGINESALLRMSLLAYLLPLVLLIAGTGLSHSVFLWSDGMSALAGVSGLICGLLLVKNLSLKLSCNPTYHPQLLSKVS